MSSIYRDNIYPLTESIDLFSEDDKQLKNEIYSAFFQLGIADSKYYKYSNIQALIALSFLFVKLRKRIYLEGYAKRPAFINKILIFLSYTYVRRRLGRLCCEDDIGFDKLSALSLLVITDDRIKNVEGSPSSLLKYPWVYLAIIQKKFHLVGEIHGGGYDEFNENTIQEFEESCSDEYFGWGLNKHKNTKCKRYRPNVWSYALTKLAKGEITSVVIPDFNHSNLPALSFQIRKAFIILDQLLSNRFDHLPAPLYPRLSVKPHPRNPQDIGYKLKVVSSIKNTDLVLIDHPYSSFLYKCIFEKRPYLMLYDKDWTPLFSDLFQEFLAEAERRNVLFYYHQVDELVMKINSSSIGDILSENENLLNFLKNNYEK